MSKIIKSITEVAFHRNGVCGVGFYAVRFVADVECGPLDANWLAIVHDEPGYCSVVCLDLIPTCGVRFGYGNSWRGDHYEPELREAISAASTGRIGPFCIPT